MSAPVELGLRTAYKRGTKDAINCAQRVAAGEHGWPDPKNPPSNPYHATDTRHAVYVSAWQAAIQKATK